MLKGATIKRPYIKESIIIIGTRMTRADIPDQAVKSIYNCFLNNISNAIGTPNKAANGHPKIKYIFYYPNNY